jgi:hypothetical protein
MAYSGYVSTKKCAGIVGCSWYIFELNRGMYSKWQFLGYATVVFGERYDAIQAVVVSAHTAVISALWYKWSECTV